MDNLKWRRRARVAAWIDLALTALELTLLIVFSIIRIYKRIQQKESDTSNGPKVVVYKSEDEHVTVTEAPMYSIPVLILILVGILTILILYFGAQFWAGIKLLRSTDIGRDIHEALQMSKMWMIVTIILVVLETLFDLFRGWTGLIVLSVILVINAGFIFVVYSFRKELKLSRGQLLV